MTPTADSLQGFRNRIINGDMRIDQRNNGASISPTSAAYGFAVDRWPCYNSTAGSKFSIQRSTDAPSTFSNSTLVTSSSAYSVAAGDQFYFVQFIEGFNSADFAFGTASAKTVTLSFWVKSSLTGTFGGSLMNSAYNRSYPFSYTISAANTWEQKTVTIAGDTTGTWIGSTNGLGLRVHFGLGIGSTYSGTAGAWAAAERYAPTGAVSVVGTNGATWYITGVQLEVGSVATPFERIDYGRELAMCQRYYYKITSTTNQLGVGWNQNTTASSVMTTFPVTMRTAPSALEQTGTAANYRILHTTTATTCSAVPAFSRGQDHSAITEFTVASGLTAGQGSAGAAASGVTAYLAWSAEL
jgi:hypothetical protein